MTKDLIKAHLNLCAVLQNLEDLVKLDGEMARLVHDWDVVVQFSVRNGPAASVTFKNGNCTHEVGRHPNPTIKLYFISPAHLNSMFDGKGTPIVLRGLTRIGFLKKDFTQLTERLSYYLKPDNNRLADEGYVKINTILTLNTAVHAAKELATLEPSSKRIAAETPHGTFQLEVLPDGPFACITLNADGISVRKGKCDAPMAKMVFKDLPAANAMLTGRLNAFLAVAQGDVILQGQLPIIDNVNLILDRVPAYLT
jgi:hypothetical protein